jgi:condensin complex subunit 1
MYRPLTDRDASVRKNALMVLSHLILNDMMKVKGHIARLALCLEDEQPRIAALAQLFFHELAKKEYKVGQK